LSTRDVSTAPRFENVARRTGFSIDSVVSFSAAAGGAGAAAGVEAIDAGVVVDGVELDVPEDAAAAVTAGGGAGGRRAGFGASRASRSAVNWSSGEQGVVSAVFDSDDEAREAITALRSEGISDASLSLITQRRGTTTTSNVDGDVVDEEHSNWLRGILGGGLLGAGLGVAALAIPGVGPLVAAGAIAASAVPGAMAIGAVAGAALGTAAEALKEHGVSDDDVAYYGNALNKNGGVLVTVHPHGDASKQTIQQILHAHGGHNAAQPRTA
jgi:hypothetical protein